MKNIETKYENFINSFNDESPLIEGIDIDFLNKTVSFNSQHENNVNTSTLINPTYHKINGYDVISIFKRAKSDVHNLDGNPLIKALKGLDGWNFKNCENDIKSLLKQFIKIVNKIEEKYDTIIVVPSRNKLNTEFLHRLNGIIKCENVIEDFFQKLTTEEIIDYGIDREKINLDKNPYQILNILLKYLKDMDANNQGYFSYKFIKDLKYRVYFKNTIRYKDGINLLDYSEMINNKNILILDDTISSGNTISEISINIMDTYSPANITIITLFSPLI